MTPAQLSTLKTFINNDPTLSAVPNTTDGAIDLAALLNQVASPNFFVFRTDVPVSEIMGNGFAWDRVDNMTVGKSRIWEFMTQLGSINPSQANVIAGVNAAFTAGADQAMRLGIFGHCQRKASRFEKIFATGSGTTTSDLGVGPGAIVVEGPVSPAEVQNARNS